jgi:hypothetical protein
MKIIKEGQADPDFLASLDKTKNIIMCVPPVEADSIVELESFPDTFGIILARDLNLSDPDIVRVSINALSATIRPKIKISFPVGLKIQFSDFAEDDKQNIFLNTYKSYDLKSVYEPESKKVLSHYLIQDMVFVMYLDTLRMRQVGVELFIKKGLQLADFYFTWYVQTKRDMPQIEEIYLIKDLHIYEDFVNIF